MRVGITNDWATVRVTNSASHPVSLSDRGSGLQGMRQRAELLGGSFRAGPSAAGMAGSGRRCPLMAGVSRPDCPRHHRAAR